MAIDAELLEQARAAEERVIDAEHNAEVARADFHRAIRRLQLAGASLREIAVALGLSHQRVHQIVEAAGGSRRWRKGRGDAGDPRCCSFCGRAQRKVKKLVAGPGAYICELCIPVVGGKRRHEVTGLASTGATRICAECLRLCLEILDERLA